MKSVSLSGMLGMCSGWVFISPVAFFTLERPFFYYKAKSKDDDRIIEDELRSLAQVHTNWGF